jgi:DNA-binding transcriptional ArsR family regulator
MHDPANVRIIDDPETLRLIADPLRLRLLEFVRQRSRTVTELSELLNVGRTKLYYHVKLLEEHNLLEVEATRQVSGITEKRYRVTAYRFSVDKSILGNPVASDTSLDVFLSVVLDEVAGEIRRSVASGLIELEHTHQDQIAPRALTIGRTWFEFDDAQVDEFRKRFEEFSRDFDSCRTFKEPGSTGSNPGKALYEWLIAFYPVVPPASESERES